MTARILDGNAIRNQIYAELEPEIAELRGAGIQPGLAAVLVGNNAASQVYVKSKIAACEKLGLNQEKAKLTTEHFRPPRPSAVQLDLF